MFISSGSDNQNRDIDRVADGRYRLTMDKVRHSPMTMSDHHQKVKRCINYMDEGQPCLILPGNCKNRRIDSVPEVKDWTQRIGNSPGYISEQPNIADFLVSLKKGRNRSIYGSVMK